MMMVIGWAMWRRSKGAWVAAVFFSLWAVAASLLTLLTWPGQGSGPYVTWFGFGLLIGLAEMAVLLSRPARRWVDYRAPATDGSTSLDTAV